jgi:hypothetical protein
VPITIIAQDLITVQLNAAATAVTVVQPERDWPDLGPYQDLAVYTYISQQGAQIGGGAAGSLNVDFSPLKEDAAFGLGSFNIGASTTPSGWTLGGGTGVGNFHLSSSPGFMRYMRWRIVGPTTGGIATWTFRIVLSVNPAPK